MTDVLADLSDQGVAIWLDDLSRDRLASGNLAELVQDKHVVGVTSNPTIFAKALAHSENYTEQLRNLAVRQVPLEEAVRAITTYDIRWAADVLRSTYERTGHLDGRVSLEVDPRIAHDTERTVAEARALVWMVDRPNIFIKIPATAEGLPAITRTLAAGISVNVTLTFSVNRYDQVIDAFMAGLEAARDNGHDISELASVASFFVSRVDTETDKRLGKVDGPEARSALGRAAIANARVAYQHYQRAFDTDRWGALADAGARPQRPLWASTGVKNPDYDDTRYVVELVAPNTVNTMPESTLNAVADHGRLRGDTVRPFYDEANATLDELVGLGVSYDDVTQTLEDDGVRKFADSWASLHETVRTQLDAVKAGKR